jgi:hypothetical protein
MNFIIGLKDFIFEMITPKTSIKFKKMRFLARFPDYRRVHNNTTRNVDNTNQKNIKHVILNEETDTVVNELTVNGYSESIELESSTVAKIIKFLDGTFFMPDRSIEQSVRINFKDENSPSTSSIYSILNPHLRSELMREIVEDPQLIHIAEKYLDTQPILMNSQIWYTFPNTVNRNHHNFGFHYDIDDYRFLKFFFYLDEVTDDNGPHVIIKATHNEASLFKFFNRRISNELAQVRYSEKIIYMKGKSGQGFAEDTFCYHKGCYPKKRRLIFQIQFGITNKVN